MPETKLSGITFMNMKKERKREVGSVQLWLAIILVLTGCGMLIAGFIVPPAGKVDSSVLVAFGETMTFAGALLGLDNLYKSKSNGV